MNRSSSNFVKYGAMAAAFAALAIIMIPGVSLFPAQHSKSAVQSAAQVEVPLTEQELAICNSVHDQLNSTIVPNQNHTEAVDLLNGVYCNRADLVHMIGNSSFPATGLAAYACEATNGTIQDPTASEELQQFQDVYCTSAAVALHNGTASVGAISSSLGQLSDFSSKSAQVSAILANSTKLEENHKPYSAYVELDRAANIVTNATGGS